MTTPPPPPDTRAAGQTGHIADHNAISDALASLENAVQVLEADSGGGGGGAVSTVFGRAGNVVAESDDYAVWQVTGAAPLASPAFTGEPTATTQSPGDNSTKIATDAFVAAAVALLAPLVSPAFSGTPTAPTQTPGDDSTKLATTGFVSAAVTGGGGAVSSVFGRTGPVTAESGDYLVGEVTGAAPSLRLIYADLLSGVDPTGATDSTAAIKTAQTAQGSSPYRIVLGLGTYLIGTSADLDVFGPNQGLLGCGSALTEINYVGSGTCVAAYESSFSSSSVGGPFGGFSISGYSASGSAKGLSWGNLQGARCNDITISGFPGTGLYLHNGNVSTEWAEEAEWTAIRLIQNANNLVFDTGSFDYGVFQALIVANAGQNGVTLQNGATLAGERFELRGNFVSGVGNTAWVIGLDPAGGGSGTSSMTAASIYVNVECDGTTGTGHVTIKMDGSSSTQLTGNGTMNFLPGTVAFTGMTALASLDGIFAFSGTVNEPTLGSMSAGDAHVFVGGTLHTEAGSLSTNFAYTGMDIYPQFGEYQSFVLPSGATTIAGFNGAPYKGARHLYLYLKQPSSGGAGTLTWPANVKWAGGSHATSGANSAIDRAELVYLPSENEWFGIMTTAYA
jgi:hypothetical protein